MQVHVQSQPSEVREASALREAYINANELTNCPGWEWLKQRLLKRARDLHGLVLSGRGTMTERELDVALTEISVIEQTLNLPESVKAAYTRAAEKQQGPAPLRRVPIPINPSEVPQ